MSFASLLRTHLLSPGSALLPAPNPTLQGLRLPPICPGVDGSQSPIPGSSRVGEESHGLGRGRGLSPFKRSAGLRERSVLCPRVFWIVLLHLHLLSWSLQVSPSLGGATHRWQPTRLRDPWDSPGKNTGVGCRFLLQCLKVKSESEVHSVMSDS